MQAVMAQYEKLKWHLSGGMRKSTKNIWMGCLLRFELNTYNRTLWSLVRIKEGVLGVKVYGSRHPVSKRTGDIGVAKIRKGRKTSGMQQPWEQGDGGGQALGTWRY